MITFYHSPHSRSTRIVGLLAAMGALDKVDIRLVSIVRNDGSGAKDSANPHPDGKVPYLVHNGTEIWESPAIILYLTDHFGGPMGVSADDPARGSYISWLVWYGSVVEPVLILHAAGIEHAWVTAALRGMPQIFARLRAALDKGPWLMGDRYTAVDLLLASPFLWFRDSIPDDPVIADWISRCEAQPSGAVAAAFDERALAA